MNQTHPLLEEFLRDWSAGDDQKSQISLIVCTLAKTCGELSEMIARGPLIGDMAAVVGDEGGGDAQKHLDVVADNMFKTALEKAPVGIYASEENPDAIYLDESKPYVVAIDPLDGSSNIDTNVSVGAIWGISPISPEPGQSANDVVIGLTGRDLVASGFFVFGPQHTLVMTVKDGTHIFTYDREDKKYKLTTPSARIQTRPEYAINASNYRHWDEAIRVYIDDLIAGASGPRGKDFNMRWIASLVAEASRIFVRGGIFLYPRDDRAGYEQGRIRLFYEAAPIALLVEHAGGQATNGVTPILDIEASKLHQRVPLIFGASEKVERVRRYYLDEHIGENQPLFRKRGLFR